MTRQPKRVLCATASALGSVNAPMPVARQRPPQVESRTCTHARRHTDQHVTCVACARFSNRRQHAVYASRLTGTVRSCSACSFDNHPLATRCAMCNTKQPNVWSCSACSFDNHPLATRCAMCNTSCPPPLSSSTDPLSSSSSLLGAAASSAPPAFSFGASAPRAAEPLPEELRWEDVSGGAGQAGAAGGMGSTMGAGKLLNVARNTTAFTLSFLALLCNSLSCHFRRLRWRRCIYWVWRLGTNRVCRLTRRTHRKAQTRKTSASLCVFFLFYVHPLLLPSDSELR
jgi:hypothetical protein